MKQRQSPATGATESGGERASSTVVLLRRVSEGDREAIERLYERYLQRLRRWARGRLPIWARDVLDTDDLVQDTMLRTFRGIEAFRPEHSGAFQAYLRRVLLNRIRDELRRVARRPAREGTVADAPDEAPSPVEEAIGREALLGYEAALERLEPGDREAILARVELDLSYREVAETLGKPSADAARMAVSRALARLAGEMARGV